LDILPTSVQYEQQQHKFNGPLSGTNQVSRYQKGKNNLDFTEQETMGDSGISSNICKSAPHPTQIPEPAPPPLKGVQYEMEKNVEAEKW